MQNATKEFLTKLAALLEEYNVVVSIEESCKGYGGFTADGFEFDITYSTEEGYKRDEYIYLQGSWFDCEEIREKLK